MPRDLGVDTRDAAADNIDDPLEVAGIVGEEGKPGPRSSNCKNVAPAVTRLFISVLKTGASASDRSRGFL
jgi:hypothetical protein